MYFRQILHEDLGCASYFIADRDEAAVIDPKWDIDDYLRIAREAGAAIRHVLETHHHADHVSGRGRLATATGAAVYVPADLAETGSPGLRDGDVVRVGDVSLRAVAASGHRPEHLAFLVSDSTRLPDQPCLLLSGDSLLIGDVARPDLAVAAEEGASALFDTLARFEALADHVELWPAHVGGSLCGSGSLSPKPSSTIGYERLANPLLTVPTREAFIAELTRTAPPRPPTVERVVALNQDATRAPDDPQELDIAGLRELIADGGCVLDVRAPDRFDAGHLKGALSLPLGGRGLGTRAGWAVGLEDPIVIVAATLEAAKRVAILLHAAGLWNVEGVAAADPAAWVGAGLSVRTATALAPDSPRLVAGEWRLLDVRDPSEWDAGHIDPSLHLPLSALGDGRGVGLPGGRPLAVACAAGNRAALAASVLRRRGYPEVARVVGGVHDLARHGAAWVNGTDDIVVR